MYFFLNICWIQKLKLNLLSCHLMHLHYGHRPSRSNWLKYSRHFVLFKKRIRTTEIPVQYLKKKKKSAEVLWRLILEFSKKVPLSESWTDLSWVIELAWQDVDFELEWKEKRKLLNCISKKFSTVTQKFCDWTNDHHIIGFWLIILIFLYYYFFFNIYIFSSTDYTYFSLN